MLTFGVHGVPNCQLVLRGPCVLLAPAKLAEVVVHGSVVQIGGATMSLEAMIAEREYIPLAVNIDEPVPTPAKMPSALGSLVSANPP
jgi:hypothetical protein